MKAKPTLQLLRHALCLLTLGFGLTLAAQTANLVRVTAIVKSERDDPKDSEKEIAKKHLEIELFGSNAISGEVKVTCTFFADDEKAGKVVALKSSDLKTILEPGKTASLVSAEETFAFTPEHSEKTGNGNNKGKGNANGNGNGKGKGNNNRPNFKSIDASGTRYHGWAVRVFRGSELVGEAYSNRTIMIQFEKK